MRLCPKLYVADDVVATIRIEYITHVEMSSRRIRCAIQSGRKEK